MAVINEDGFEQVAVSDLVDESSVPEADEPILSGSLKICKGARGKSEVEVADGNEKVVEGKYDGFEYTHGEGDDKKGEDDAIEKINHLNFNLNWEERLYVCLADSSMSRLAWLSRKKQFWVAYCDDSLH